MDWWSSTKFSDARSFFPYCGCLQIEKAHRPAIWSSAALPAISCVRPRKALPEGWSVLSSADSRWLSWALNQNSSCGLGVVFPFPFWPKVTPIALHGVKTSSKRFLNVTFLNGVCELPQLHCNGFGARWRITTGKFGTLPNQLVPSESANPPQDDIWICSRMLLCCVSCSRSMPI